MEDKPRVTITAELFEELQATKKRYNELRVVAEDLMPKVWKLIERYDRRRRAALRLAGMHKAHSKRLLDRCNDEQAGVQVLSKQLVRVEREREEARRLAEMWHTRYRFPARADRPHKGVRMAKPLPWVTRVKLPEPDKASESS